MTHPNARLEAFCDGVFAIAITLLIIDLRIPVTTAVHSNSELWSAIYDLLPAILSFILSFAIIFITWVNHHNAMKLAIRSSSAFIYANGLLLLSVVFIPFPTALMGEYILTDHASPAVMLYTSVLILQSFGWAALCNAGLNAKLFNGQENELVIRKNRLYAYFSVVGYSALTVMAIWFPIPVVIFTVILWILWTIIGINLRQTESQTA